MNVRIENLQKSFGEKKAVDVDSHLFPSGEIIGLVGNNGAGKTTLFRLLLDLIKADGGNVFYEYKEENGVGHSINPAANEDWKPMTGAYIDDSFLIDFLTPEEYFHFIGKISGISAEEIDHRLADYEPFMAGEVLGQEKYIRSLSAGNKMKVGIVAALLTRPRLIILDEPFNFLDPSSQNKLKHLLAEYNQQHGATIIISSHNLAHTVEVSTQITLMEGGKIIKTLDNHEQKAEEELKEYFEV